jgi:hypothetical protein
MPFPFIADYCFLQFLAGASCLKAKNTSESQTLKIWLE